MKNRLLTVALIFISFSVHAQDFSEPEVIKISKEDSTDVDLVFKKFISAAENNKRDSVLNFCLNQIDCSTCFKLSEYQKDGYLISKKKFYKKSFPHFFESQVFKALKKRGYHISGMSIKNYKPSNIPDEYGNDLILYEIWIQTFLPNEWFEGDEGQSNAFQFIKINNQFKLYGLTSIP